MPSSYREFIIPARRGITDLTTRFFSALDSSQLNWVEKPVITLTRTYYDSHDWRLYRNDIVLEIEHGAGLSQLILHRPSTRAIVNRTAVEGIPRFAHELPAGLLRDQLQTILAPRALLALASVTTCRHQLQLLNSDDKMILRVLIDQNEIGNSTKDFASSCHRLSLVAVKGYPKPIARLEKIITEELGLAASKTPLWTTALAARQRSPGDYSSKFSLGLDPARMAAMAARDILIYLWEMLKANETGARNQWDSEFLHDFRIAIRRTRSALSQLKRALPAALHSRFQAEFAWLGQITGPARDLDVYLQKFSDYQRQLPATTGPDLEPLLQLLRQHRQQAQLELVKQLSSPRYRALRKNWQQALQSEKLWHSQANFQPQAMIAIKPLADRRLHKLQRRYYTQGQLIVAATPAQALHELRKTGKKLRYLIEFFHSLYPAKRIGPVLKALKQLQDNLGDFQDLEVQATLLRCYSRQLSGAASADALLAMGSLIAHLEQQQLMAREQFARRFAKFNKSARQTRFTTLFDTR